MSVTAVQQDFGELIFASWPQHFRVRAFGVQNSSFQDLGDYVLETPKVGENGDWSWLTTQLCYRGLLNVFQRVDCRIEVFNGRAISVMDAEGRGFLLLMPS